MSALDNWVARDEAKRKLMEEKDQSAKASGTLVGRYIQHSHADGYAYYEIIKVTKTKARIKVLEIGDAWVLPAWGREAIIPRSQAAEFVRRRDAMAALFNKRDDWWQQRKLGEIVHYNNGFGQFVRGVIIETDGKKQMRPIALVGGWSRSDISTRSDDGSIRYGTWAKWILEGKLSQPNASNMFECPDASDKSVNPRSLPDLQLDPPPMTKKQEALAALMKRHNKVREALAIQPADDIDERIEHVRDSLLLVKSLLRDLE